MCMQAVCCCYHALFCQTAGLADWLVQIVALVGALLILTLSILLNKRLAGKSIKFLMGESRLLRCELNPPCML